MTLFAVLVGVFVAHAGGDPRQVVVVANAESEDSQDIAAHYALSRQLPDGHVCALTDLPVADRIDFATYAATVQPQVRACLAGLPDPDAIQYLVTTRDLPYVVDLEAGYVVGFEALLQVGDAVSRLDGSPLAGTPQTDAGGYYAASVANPLHDRGSTTDCDLTLENPAAGWYTSTCGYLSGTPLPEPLRRQDIRTRGDWDFADAFFIVTRLDGFDSDDAMDLVDRGVAADGTWPEAPLLCMHGADSARGARDPECERALRALDGAGLPTTWVDTFDASLSGHTVAAYFTGAAGLTGAIDGQTYVPGALTCNLTSFGAVPQNFHCDATGETCPASELQTSIARFVRAGATGAHGTVAEPLNNVFPNASALLLYTFGYSLGESYTFSQRHVYWQNLVLGDPLTTPYAMRPTLSIPESVPADGVLEVAAEHADGVRTVSVVVDGLEVASGSAPLSVPASALGAVGDVVDVYVVAEAEDAVRERPGWPSSTPITRSRVRGWEWTTVEVTEATDPDPEDTAVVDTGGQDTALDDPAVDTGGSGSETTAGPAKGAGGGCSTTPQRPALDRWAGLMGGLVLLSVAWRRRVGAL